MLEARLPQHSQMRLSFIITVALAIRGAGAQAPEGAPKASDRVTVVTEISVKIYLKCGTHAAQGPQTNQ